MAHLHLFIYNEDRLLLQVLLNDLVVWFKEDDCRHFELHSDLIDISSRPIEINYFNFKGNKK